MNRIERWGERFFGGGGDKNPTYPMVNAGWGVEGGHTCPFFPCDLGGELGFEEEGKERHDESRGEEGLDTPISI